MRLFQQIRNQFTASCLFLLVFFMGFSQQKAQDTLVHVKKYQDESFQALRSQNFDEAIIKLTKANSLMSESKEVRLKGDIKLRIGNLYYFLQNYDKAAAETERAVEIFLETGQEDLLAQSYNLLALINTNRFHFTEAESYAKQANSYFIKQNDELGQADVIFTFGSLELKRGNYTSAINYFDAAIPLLEKFDSNYQLTFAYLEKAEAYLQLEDGAAPNTLQHARTALDNAKRLLEGKNFTKLEIESYRITSRIALKENKFSSAEEYLTKYESKNDSLFQVYLGAISKGVDAESNIGDLNEIIAAKNTELDKKQKSINFGKMTTGLSIALIVILSLLTLSLYKNNNLRAKANDLLQDKNTELQLAKEKAEKASLAKAQFLSTITHELRTPLYAVTGLTHLLLEENPKPDQKEHLNSLKFSGEYLLSLINNILDLNKLEANKVEVEKTTFGLKKRISDVLVALKKSAEDRRNNLHFEFDESIPEKLVGDPLKLSQILINLVGNSVKFTQNGDVSVRVKRLDQHNEKVTLHFEIEDNGVGISKKKQKSIFETFSQASLQINRKFGGTGLGLSIVKNLLELMGSRIHLESQLGKGSKFWFDIRFDIAEELREDKNPQIPVVQVDYSVLENRNVLVVEDNKINQMITRKILEKNKMNCMVADNGMDAIALIKEHTYDVILMDIHMPGISGIEATQKVRQFDSQLPIIALTAVTIDENLDDFYKAGFNEIIPKPFKTEEFFEKIYRTLENSKIPI